MDTTDPRIEELRRAAVADPRNGEVRYLLGVELAQQRQYDQAVLELSAAVALNPLLHTARLQLGLLHLTMAQPDHATQVLAPLESLDDQSALKHFKRGLEALAVDDFNAAIENLAHGIELNRENAPLNGDMQMLLERIRRALSTQSTPPEDPEREHTDFSLYGVTRH